MSVNSNKRKGRLNLTSNRMGRPKIYNEKLAVSDGLYGNLRMMYATTSLVGCVVQIQVQSGAIFEGVLRTFSHQFDVVLEMAHKVNPKNSPAKGVSSTVQNLISSFPFDGGIFEKLVFKHCDIIFLKACNIDVDFAVKDNFTDKAISKFDGHVKEKELEPWEGAESDTENISLAIEDDDGTNGWDANDMFRTNAEKYGIKSSYDHTLPEYTVPLTKKDTEEYKLQEAKAMKIAHEIEASSSYQTKILLENGDEEDRYSAVMRPPEDSVSSKYILSQKRYNPPGPKKAPSSSPTSTCLASSMPYSAVYLTGSENKQYPFMENPQSFPSYASISKDRLLKMPTTEKATPVLNSSSVETVPALTGLPEVQVVCSQHVLPLRTECNEEKLKGESTDKIEELRKFSTSFKLTTEKKQLNEVDVRHGHSDLKSEQGNLIPNVERLKMNNDDESANIVKYSTLNPNAKSFTPRSLPLASSQVSLPVQSQSPVMSIPQSQIVQQPIFTAVAPQYIMQTTPASVAPFVAAPSLSQAARFHKALPSQPPMQMQYSSSGVIHASAPPQQALRYPQVNFVVGPPVVSPQAMGLAPAEHGVSYCETTHVPAHVIMPARPGVPLPATPPHSLQQRPPQSQTPILHPSLSPVHQLPAPHSQPPTPPSIMYPFPGQHSLEDPRLLHSQGHPGFSSGSHPMVLMQQPAPTSIHSHHSVHMSAHNPPGTTVHMLPHMTNTVAKTSISTAFVQHP